ncbi:aspartic proteinase-like protein 2 [Phtheirospermum japonicum]|uniref:Aspartic proteinase-like protein 2 n=1 Tax=Phtheirospermum japonicum TaxID=374723 RepID=A0A830BRX5_9LAMI|nr:aspartic proteinase-like protein 2 [Phtheirospermum japonicum]
MLTAWLRRRFWSGGDSERFADVEVEGVQMGMVSSGVFSKSPLIPLILRVAAIEVAPFMTCPFCHKLLRDATTIIECLHTCVQAKNSRYYIPPKSRSSNSIAPRLYDSIEKDIDLEFFDPSSSSTASLISCSDQRCALGTQSSDSGCSDQNQCSYTFQYGDGSGTSGFYVDVMKPDRAVDGIFSFGQQGLSVISQLSSQGITPNAFSHCLKGEDGGGGILVLGQIVEPNLVYTPLVPSQPHYNVNLQSIVVNGQTLNVNPAVFSTSSNRGTIIDSGTSAYFAEEAYDPFVDAITQSVSQSVRPLLSKGNQCYLTTLSVSSIFPPVSLNFAGGASMILRPQDYLLQQNSLGGAAVWCIGIQKIQSQRITILGDCVEHHSADYIQLFGSNPHNPRMKIRQIHREATARTVREKAQARARWKSSKEAARKRSIYDDLTFQTKPESIFIVFILCSASFFPLKTMTLIASIGFLLGFGLLTGQLYSSTQIYRAKSNEVRSPVLAPKKEAPKEELVDNNIDKQQQVVVVGKIYIKLCYEKV